MKTKLQFKNRTTGFTGVMLFLTFLMTSFFAIAQTNPNDRYRLGSGQHEYDPFVIDLAVAPPSTVTTGANAPLNWNSGQGGILTITGQVPFYRVINSNSNPNTRAFNRITVGPGTSLARRSTTVQFEGIINLTNPQAAAAFSVQAYTTVTMFLFENSVTTFTGAANFAGLFVDPLGHVIINSDPANTAGECSDTENPMLGKLNAMGGPAGNNIGSGAGIGGHANQGTGSPTWSGSSGDITINGGLIVAQGGPANANHTGSGAGIGGGGGRQAAGGGTVGMITITCGLVRATGGTVVGGSNQEGGAGAGIGGGGGGGPGGSGSGYSGGHLIEGIKITGCACVIAQGGTSNNGGGGAGIGGGGAGSGDAGGQILPGAELEFEDPPTSIVATGGCGPAGCGASIGGGGGNSANEPTVTIRTNLPNTKTVVKGHIDGESLSVVAQLNNFGEFSYQWYKTTDRTSTGVAMPGQTNEKFNLIDSDHIPGQPYFYYVEVWARRGSVNFPNSRIKSNVTQVIVLDPTLADPRVVISVGDDTTRNYSFPSRHDGYTMPSIMTVGVRNTGNIPFIEFTGSPARNTRLKAKITSETWQAKGTTGFNTADRFINTIGSSTTGVLELPDLFMNSTTTFNLGTHTGLAQGTYRATIELSAFTTDLEGFEPISFNVEFTVSEHPITLIEVKHRPKLDYFEGEHLDLSDLIVDLRYSNMHNTPPTVEWYRDVNFGDAVNLGIVANPANETRLTHNLHNNRHIRLSWGTAGGVFTDIVPALTVGSTYAITLNSEGIESSIGGTYILDTLNNKKYAQGTVITINAGADPGVKQFIKWTTNSLGVVFANANSRTTTFVMPGNDVTVTAVFGYEVTFSSTPSSGFGELTATANGDPIQTGALVVAGTSLVFTATPVDGHRVGVWTVDGVFAVGEKEENDVEILRRSVSGNLDVNVSFIEAGLHTVTFDANGGDYNGTNGTPTTWTIHPEAGDLISVPVFGAFTRANHALIGWSLNKNSGGEGLWNFQHNVEGDMILYAVWREVLPGEHLIYYVANGGTYANVNSPEVRFEIVSSGGLANPNPLPLKGTDFIEGWYETENGTGSKWIFTNPVNRNLTLYAKWVPTYTVTVVDGEVTGGVIVNGAERFVAGHTITISAIDSTKGGYAFVEWTEITDVVFDRTEDVTTFLMPAKHVTVTATYTPIIYNIALSVTPVAVAGNIKAFVNDIEVANVVSGSGVIQATVEDIVELRAGDEVGYRFFRWFLTKTVGGGSVNGYLEGTSQLSRNVKFKMSPNDITARVDFNQFGINLPNIFDDELIIDPEVFGYKYDKINESNPWWGQNLQITTSGFISGDTNLPIPLTITLTGPNANSFDISNAPVDVYTINNLAGSALLNFSPKSDLPAGTYIATVTIEGEAHTGIFKEFEVKFTVEPRSFGGGTNFDGEPYSAATVTINETFTFNGQPQSPNPDNVTVAMSFQNPNGATIHLTPDYDVDYDFSVSGGTNAGTAVITVSAKGNNYVDAVIRSFNIVRKPLTDTDITVEIDGFVYNTLPQTLTAAEVTIMFGAIKLVEGTDFEIVGDVTQTETGTYPFQIVGKGNYTGTLSEAFEIEKANQTPSLALTFTPAPIAGEYTFGDGPITLGTTGGSGTGAITYTITASEFTNVATIAGNILTINRGGSFTVRATKSGDNNYNEATASENIIVNLKDAVNTDFICIVPHYDTLTYNGISKVATVTMSNSAHDLSITGALSTWYQGTGTTTYGPINVAPTDAGTYDVYVRLAGGTGYHATGTPGVKVGNFEIRKAIATPPSSTQITEVVAGRYAQNYIYHLFHLYPEGTFASGDAETISYTPQLTLNEGVLVAGNPYTLSGDILTLHADDLDLSDVGNKAEISVDISSTNYETFTVTLIVNVVNKELVNIIITMPTDLVYTGLRNPYESLRFIIEGSYPEEDITADIISGGYFEIDYRLTGAGSGSELAPINAGNYTVTVTIVNSNDYIGEGSTPFTIARAEQEINMVDEDHFTVIFEDSFYLDNLAITSADGTFSSSNLIYSVIHDGSTNAAIETTVDGKQILRRQTYDKPGTIRVGVQAPQSVNYLAAVPISFTIDIVHRPIVPDLSVVIAPVAGATPVRTITADKYVGAVVWKYDLYGTETVLTGNFDYYTKYTAEITVDLKTGYTFNGIAENSLIVGVDPNDVLGSHIAGSLDPLVVTAVFPEYEIPTTEPNLVRVFFMNEDGLTRWDAKVVEAGSPVARPTENPEKDDHIFQGWFEQDATTAWYFTTPVMEDLTLYAKFIPEPVVGVQAKVTFVVEGIEWYTEVVNINSRVTKPAIDPLKADHHFIGWFTDETANQYLWDFNSVVDEDMKLHAGFAQDIVIAEYHVVTFIQNNGNAPIRQEVAHNGKAIKPTNPVRPGFVFTGWFTEGDYLWDFNTPITDNLTLFAIWQPNAPVGSHIVTFVPNNGDALIIKTVLNGQTVDRPTPDPELAGHFFVGWFTEGYYLWNFDSAVKGNMTLFAIYEKNAPTDQYAVTFILNNGEKPFTEYVTKGDPITKPIPDPQRSGYVFAGWLTEDYYLWDFRDAVESDMMLYAHWSDREQNMHTITFVLNNGEEPFTRFVPDLGRVPRPETDPTRQDHDFVGWFREGGSFYYFDAPVTSNLTLYAEWSYSYAYVTFDATEGAFGGGEKEVVERVLKGRPTPQVQSPVLDDHIFIGWYDKDDRMWNFVTPIAEDMTLYAKWVENPNGYYAVTFQGNGGTFEGGVTYKTVLVHIHTPMNQTDIPINPTKDGYVFTGWYWEWSCMTLFDFRQPVNLDMFLYAGWTPIVPGKYNVTFVTNNGITAPYTNQVDNDNLSLVAEPTPPPTRDDHIFKGWFNAENNNLWNFNTPVTKDMTLYAGWELYQEGKYAVIFAGNGGTPDYELVFVAHDMPIPTNLVPNVDRPMYYFTGWYTDPTCNNLWYFADPVTQNMTLYAGWEQMQGGRYAVIFAGNGGEPGVTVKLVNANAAMSISDAPVVEKPEYGFTGWYTEVACITLWNFNTPITETMTLFAGWKQLPTGKLAVTFAGNGGTPDHETVLVDANVPMSIDVVQNPARTNFVFTGWYTEPVSVPVPASATLWNFNDNVTESMVLYAGWAPEETGKFAVIFVGNGGTPDHTVRFVNENTLILGNIIPTVERTGYVFTGWYTEWACNTLWNFGNNVTQNMFLYAGWEEFDDNTQVVVTFNRVNGEQNIVKVITKGALVEPPATPIRPGYAFTGWYTALTGGELFEFTTPVNESFTLFARWQLVQVVYPVTFSVTGGNGTLTATVDDVAISSGDFVQLGKNVVFTANPNTNYAVMEWKNNGTTVNGTNEVYNLTVSETHNVTVEFILTKFTVTVVSIGAGSTGGGDYEVGETVNIFAGTTPAGMNFANWTASPGVAFANANNPTTTFTMQESNVTVTANFTPIITPKYTVTIVSEGDEPIGEGEYEAGEIVQIHAGANPYEKNFSHWESSHAIPFHDVHNPTTTFMMPAANVTKTAKFAVLDFDKYVKIKWGNTMMLDVAQLHRDGYNVESVKWFAVNAMGNATQLISTSEYAWSAGPRSTDKIPTGVRYYFEIKTSNHIATQLSTRKLYNNEISESPELSMYPNPLVRGNTLTIEGLEKGSLIEVTNLMGFRLHSTTANSETVTLNLNLPLGTYLIRTNNGEAKLVVIN
jgi:uncharacterized repeat protein (TIGR02543 family)